MADGEGDPHPGPRPGRPLRPCRSRRSAPRRAPLSLQPGLSSSEEGIEIEEIDEGKNVISRDWSTLSS